MSGYNFNHFTGKTRGKASRKKKIRMKQNHKDKYEKYSNTMKIGTVKRNRLRRVSNAGGAECKDITIQNIAEKDWKRQQDN